MTFQTEEEAARVQAKVSHYSLGVRCNSLRPHHCVPSRHIISIPFMAACAGAATLYWVCIDVFSEKVKMLTSSCGFLSSTVCVCVLGWKGIYLLSLNCDLSTVYISHLLELNSKLVP